jgi:hypothetical protein
MPSLSYSNVTETTIDWTISGLGSLWDSDSYQRIVLCTGTVAEGSTTAPSGIYDTRYPPTPPGSGYGFTETCYNLTPATSYLFYAYALAQNGRWYAAGSSIYVTTDSPGPSRPSDWSWWYSKSSGIGFNVYGSEWNDFADRINTFRAYKNIGNYGFTDAYSGMDFYAYMFNQARNAIADLPRTVNVPSAVSSGSDVYAYMLAQLRDALNSTT